MATRFVWDRYNAVDALSLGQATTNASGNTTVIANLYDYNGDTLDVNAGTTVYYALYSNRQVISNSNGTSYARLSTVAQSGSIAVSSNITQSMPLISSNASDGMQYIVFYRTENFPATVNAYSYGMCSRSTGTWYTTVVKQPTDEVTKIAGQYLTWTSPTTMVVRGAANGTVSSANSRAYPSNGAIDSYWYVTKGSDNITPSAVSIPSIIYGGETILITVSPRNGTFGGTKSYLYEVTTNGGSSWTAVGVSTAATSQYFVPIGTQTISARVRVQDNYGFTDTDYVETSQVTVISNDAPTAPSSITVPETINDTDTITISWTASSDPDENLEGYILECQINDGIWQQIYNSANLSYQHAMSERYNTIAYRVKAYDSYGYESGYTTSETRELTHNAIPTSPENLQVTNVMVGEQVTITWEASTDSDGTIASYTVERSVNESGYESIYTGTALTTTDTIANEWATVSYRVKATDNEGADSPYTTGQTYTLQSGMLYLAGQPSDMGVQDKPFVFSFTPKVTGETTPYLLNIIVTHNGKTVLSTDTGYTNTEYDVPIDVRTSKFGSNVITVKVDSTSYIPIDDTFTYTVSEISFPDGGAIVTLQDSTGSAIFPQTLANSVLVDDDGKKLSTVIDEIKNNATGGFIEMETSIDVESRSANTLYGLIVDNFGGEE